MASIRMHRAHRVRDFPVTVTQEIQTGKIQNAEHGMDSSLTVGGTGTSRSGVPLKRRVCLYNLEQSQI